MSSFLKYSICMCNYNMADTIETALRSIWDQIDNEYEIVLIDDGSNDNSVEVIRALQKEFTNLRLITLERDSNRKLGFTRNASIYEAKGEYVLLHIDCDDITAPHIKDFVKIFHDIEKGMKGKFLLSGQPIQMAKREFLLTIGPYRNINRGEDRDMLSRLAARNAYLPLLHKSIKTRLPKSIKERIYRVVYYTFDHLRNDFRSGCSLATFLKYEIKYRNRFNIQYRVIRIFLSLPSWLMAKLQGPIQEDKIIEIPEEFAEYRRTHSGTYPEIMKRLGLAVDWASLSAEAKDIFSKAE